MSFKRLFVLGFVLLLIAAVPLTVFFLQQQQETRSQAERSTTLAFVPTSSTSTPIQTKVGESFDLEIEINPGSNIVANVFLEITYDPTKLATAGAGLRIENVASSIITETQYSSGNIYIELTSGTDPTKQIQSTTTLGKVTFKGLTETGTTPTQITYGTRTNAYVGGDAEAYNREGGTGEVLQSKIPAFIAVAPNPTISPSPVPTTVAALNQAPVCSSLNIDRTPSGAAPFPITFTATGSDQDGTINKITFNFGDGPVEDLTQTGGIGTNSVSAQKSHIYQAPGTFTASATLTDNQGGVSTSTTCTQIITVTQSLASTLQASPTSIVSPIIGAPDSGQTTQQTNQDQSSAEAQNIDAPGPGETIIAISIGTLFISAVGAFLFFSL